jgi:hypothetical protein
VGAEVEDMRKDWYLIESWKFPEDCFLFSLWMKYEVQFVFRLWVNPEVAVRSGNDSALYWGRDYSDKSSDPYAEVLLKPEYLVAYRLSVDNSVLTMTHLFEK